MPHRLSLSTCWNAHRYQDGLALAKEARDMGFREIEISHGTSLNLMPGLLKAVEKSIVRVSSLHAPCPAAVELPMDAPDAYEFTAKDEASRRRAHSLTVATLEMAARCGADRVVLHLGTAPVRSATATLERIAHDGGLHGRAYVREKLRFVAEREKAGAAVASRVRAALDALLPHAEKNRVRLGIETRSHFEQIPTVSEMAALLRDYADCPWIGAWHDFGHAQRQANLGFLNHEQYLTLTAPRLLGCHVHDVEWPARDHQIPYRHGGVDFDRLLPLLPEGLPLVWEMSPRQKRLDIIAAREAWEQRFASSSLPAASEGHLSPSHPSRTA